MSLIVEIDQPGDTLRRNYFSRYVELARCEDRIRSGRGRIRHGLILMRLRTQTEDSGSESFVDASGGGSEIVEIRFSLLQDFPYVVRQE